jgi:hypothetical protein
VSGHIAQLRYAVPAPGSDFATATMTLLVEDLARPIDLKNADQPRLHFREAVSKSAGTVAAGVAKAGGPRTTAG